MRRNSDVRVVEVRKALLREDLNVKEPWQEEAGMQAVFLKKPAGKNRVTKLSVDIAVLGVTVNVTVAALAKMRSESAMVIENCVARVPDASLSTWRTSKASACKT
jgi:hypothetical protein